MVRFRPVFTSLLLLLLPLAAPFTPRQPVAPVVMAQNQFEPRELEAFQGYLDPAPGGMDVWHAWTLPGGKGENVTIVDIEINWNLRHNDLVDATADPALLVRGVDPQPNVNRDHGTAVLGLLVSAPDGIGVTGICHKARVGLVSPLPEGTVLKVADAISLAARSLGPGDVLLVEQQSFAGPRFNPQTGRGLVPIEFEGPVYDAIKSATSKGIVVVEPAGNGYENLDDAVYNGAFDRSRRDSGAIIVGSGMTPEGKYGPGPDRSRTPESNYGSRVDVQGWGRYVTTCGYGDLRREQGENNWYTINFGATSAAAAMIAGAAAILQSIAKEQGGPLSPLEIRRLLTATGSPQTGDLSERIGPRPDLKAAIAELGSGPRPREPIISEIKFKNGSGKMIVDGEDFIPNDSVIEINGVAVTKVKYPGGYLQLDGTTTRIQSKGSVTNLLPRGEEVLITIYTPGSDKRSHPVAFRRE